MIARFKKFLGDLRSVISLYPDVPSIARRMFTTNSFDGIMASIGVNVGGFSHSGDPMSLALSIIGGGVSMGFISGMLGVYLSERAERLREVREVEQKVASSLKHTIYDKAARLIPVYIALWSGVGIVLFPTIIALPYIAAAVLDIPILVAYMASLAVSLASLAGLGAYLAKVSGESVPMGVARALGMGLAAIVMVLIVKNLLGAAVAG